MITMKMQETLGGCSGTPTGVAAVAISEIFVVDGARLRHAGNGRADQPIASRLSGKSSW